MQNYYRTSIISDVILVNIRKVFMLFKTMTFLRFEFDGDDNEPSQSLIEENMGKLKFRRCLPTFLESSGFFHPYKPLTSVPDVKNSDEPSSEEEDDDDIDEQHVDDEVFASSITHSIDQAILFSVVIEKKDISNIDLELRKQKKVKENLKKDGVDFKHVEKSEIKRMMGEVHQEVLDEMAKTAQVKLKRVEGVLDFKTSHLVINSSSKPCIEKICEMLDKVFGGNITLVPAKPAVDLVSIMTRWMDQNIEANPPSKFTLGTDCTLVQHGNKKTKVVCSNHDLHSNEISSHVTNYDKQVVKLSMFFEDKFCFDLDENFTFLKVKSQEGFIRKLDEAELDSQEQVRDATLSLTMMFIREALSELYEYFKKSNR